jgi:hypothetical protein
MEGTYYMKFASGAYGWKLIYGLGNRGITQVKAIAEGAKVE